LSSLPTDLPAGTAERLLGLACSANRPSFVCLFDQPEVLLYNAPALFW